MDSYRILQLFIMPSDTPELSQRNHSFGESALPAEKIMSANKFGILNFIALRHEHIFQSKPAGKQNILAVAGGKINLFRSWANVKTYGKKRAAYKSLCKIIRFQVAAVHLESVGFAQKDPDWDNTFPKTSGRCSAA